MSGGPTKSWVLGWTADHLRALDADIVKQAAQLEQAFSSHVAQAANPGGTKWTGQSNDQAVDQAQNGLDIARKILGVKDQAQKIVDQAAHDGEGQQRVAANAIASAERNSYMVLDDLTKDTVVIDLQPCDNSSESKHRALTAETYSRDIKNKAKDLWDTAQGVETKLTALGTQMQTHTFPAPGAPQQPDTGTTGKHDPASTNAASAGAFSDTIGHVNSGDLTRTALSSGYYDMSTPEGRAMAAQARQLMIDNGRTPAEADKLIKVLTTPSPPGSAEKNAPPTRAPGPQTGSEAFGENWDQTERGIRSLLGQNGGDAAKDAWTSLIEGANKTVNPIAQGLDAPDTAKALLAEGQLAVDNPRAFAGKHALDAAALIAGGPLGAEGLGALGEGRLALGAEDLAGAHGVHDALPPVAGHTQPPTGHTPIDPPSGTTHPSPVVDHPAPTMDHPAPTGGEHSMLGAGEHHWDFAVDSNGHYLPGSLPSYEQLRGLTETDPHTAHYWSGRDASGVGVGPDGSGIAERIAVGSGGDTLETTLAKNGVNPLPVWNRHDPVSVKFWEDASAAYAENAKGEVTATIGSDLRPGNIWQTVEIPRLMENPDVTKIVQIDPDTGKSTIIFSRDK